MSTELPNMAGQREKKLRELEEENKAMRKVLDAAYEIDTQNKVLKIQNADLQRRLNEATRAFGQAAKERAEALKIIEDSRNQEPSVYILPSVLRQCEATEMNAHVYSVPFTNFDIGESSVPLYKEPVAAKIPDSMVLSEELLKKFCTEFYYRWSNQIGTNTQDGYDDWFEQFGNAMLQAAKERTEP